ncbi:MAG: type II toxin-antitoxin system VapC family toxin [Candidatus Bathyarchaeia archaeon]
MERASKGIVVDASVAAKWFIPEEDSDKASKILREYADRRIEIYSPDLLIYEVANLMRYRPDINGEALAENMENLFRLQLTLIPPSPDMISEAAVKAKELNLSVYDACYVVVAEALAANLVTADGELHEKCIGEGLTLLLKDLDGEWRIQ